LASFQNDVHAHQPAADALDAVAPPAKRYSTAIWSCLSVILHQCADQTAFDSHIELYIEAEQELDHNVKQCMAQHLPPCSASALSQVNMTAQSMASRQQQSPALDALLAAAPEAGTTCFFCGTCLMMTTGGGGDGNCTQEHDNAVTAPRHPHDP
jgi:transketolase